MTLYIELHCLLSGTILTGDILQLIFFMNKTKIWVKHENYILEIEINLTKRL